MAIITLGGWDAIEGAKPLQVAYIVMYLVMAFFVLRWSRGVLPVAAALATVLLIFAAVSAPEWFDRDKSGFTDPALDEWILGLLTALLVPVQLLLIAFSMSGFRQAWNVEVEHHEEPPPERRRAGAGPRGRVIGAKRVTAPDGTTWRVGRRWLPEKPDPVATEAAPRRRWRRLVPRTSGSGTSMTRSRSSSP